MFTFINLITRETLEFHNSDLEGLVGVIANFG